MARNSIYYLLNCPMIDIAHNHTPCFSSATRQLNWFMSRGVKTVHNVQYHRKDSSIQVPFNISELELINYVITQNDNGKYYYYYVYDRVYMNDNNTALLLKLDVIQTYMFDINFAKMKSLIDRSHVDRFNTDNLPKIENLITPEDIEVGEYIETNRITVHDYSTQGGFIVASSDKLTVKNGGASGGGSTGGVQNKMISADGFVFLKGYEAFSPAPYNIGDGTNTIGYGVTEKYQPDYYNQLAPSCTEKEASEVLLKVLTNFSIQVYDTMVSYGKDMSKVSQREFDAFTSFAYNSGIGGMKSSQIFIDYCNNVSSSIIAEKWKTTNIMVGTDFEQGLRNRREAESKIFESGIYDFKPINIVGGGIVADNGGKGHIPSELLGIESETLANKIVESARELIGKPYVWGGNCPPLGNNNGTDCSGLIQWAYHQNGKNISRVTYTQIKEGYEVSQDNVQIGDLVFSNFSAPNVPEHVYLYSGNIDGVHMCVEAQQTGTNIQERAFTFTNEMRIRRLI